MSIVVVKGPVTMIMCILLSMVYGLFKPCWLTHVTCKCFKESAILFNVQLSCTVDFIPCQTEKYMFKVNNKKIDSSGSKLKINTAWHRSGVFIVDFNLTVFLLLTLNKYLSVGCERQVIVFWKHKKRYICFIINISRPILLSNLSLHRVEINYDHIKTILLYEHIMNIWFSLKFALGMPSE